MVEQDCLFCSQEYFKMQSKHKRRRRKMQKAFAEIEHLLIYKPPHYQEQIIGICEQYKGRH